MGGLWGSTWLSVFFLNGKNGIEWKCFEAGVNFFKYKLECFCGDSGLFGWLGQL